MRKQRHSLLAYKAFGKTLILLLQELSHCDHTVDCAHAREAPLWLHFSFFFCWYRSEFLAVLLTVQYPATVLFSFLLCWLVVFMFMDLQPNEGTVLVYLSQLFLVAKVLAY